VQEERLCFLFVEYFEWDEWLVWHIAFVLDHVILVHFSFLCPAVGYSVVAVVIEVVVAAAFVYFFVRRRIWGFFWQLLCWWLFHSRI